MSPFRLGRVTNLELFVYPSAVAGSVLLWIVLAGLALTITPLTPFPLTTLEAIIAGAFGVLLHWLSELLHQIGHARAARRTGYPMTGVSFWLVLGSSLYPPDEPTLPGSLHVRRALGGPAFSAIVTLIGFIITAIFAALNSPLLFWLALFFALDNLLVFTLGAFLPLGFTDGSTLLRWWGK
jgi:hypothetical protein